jgi:autotransporter-associated beta strand protein
MNPFFRHFYCLLLIVMSLGSGLRAGELLVDLEASDFAPGATKWPQHKAQTGIPGDFIAKGTPTRQVIAGAEAVVFDGDGDYFTGPVTTDALHAPGAKYSVELWAYQGNAHGKESLVSWGKRGGPDGTLAGFRYGTDLDFGALTRWGPGDMGFVALPSLGQWHHLAYTYDGNLQSVYVDGKLETSRVVGMMNPHDRLPIYLGMEIEANLTTAGEYVNLSGAIGKLRIHSGALSSGQVRQAYESQRAAFPGVTAKPLEQMPLHRFSFNAAAGPANDGSVIKESKGELAAVVRGADAKFTGSSIELRGGQPATEAYVDLPNKLVSVHEEVSLELWATQTSLRPWSRILVVGTSTVGELAQPGGTFAGAGNLVLFGNVGSTFINRFARGRGRYPNGGPDRNPAESPLADYGVEFHHVILYRKDLREWQWFRNGVLMEVIPDDDGPTKLDDVNIWLGRSEYSTDSNLCGKFSEFRVYDYALSEGEIQGNFQAGPRKLTFGEVLTAPVKKAELSHEVVAPVASNFQVESIGVQTETLDTQDHDFTLSQWINGSSSDGGILKKGSGMLTLSGTNHFTGLTDVAEGHLRLEGHVSGSARVGVGAVISGGGTIAGDLEMDAGSFFTVGQGEILWVTGKITLRDASIKLAAQDKVAGKVIVIAAYGTVEGKFSKEAPLPAGYTLDCHYENNKIALVPTAAATDGK